MESVRSLKRNAILVGASKSSVTTQWATESDNKLNTEKSKILEYVGDEDKQLVLLIINLL